MKKQSSIRAKIAGWMGAVLLISLLTVEAANVWLNYRSTVSTVEQMMQQSAALAAEVVEQQLTNYIQTAEDTGYIPQLSDPDVSTEAKQAIINQRVAINNFAQANITDTNGRSIFDGTDFSEQAHIRQALQGNVVVSEPTISKISGKMSVIIAAPLWENGVVNSRVVGAVTYIPQETFLNDIVSSVRVSKHGGAYMINQDGYTIADDTMDTVMVQNIENEAAQNKSLSKLAAIHGAMRAGKSGFDDYKINGTAKFIAYAPVSGTSGWSLGVTAAKIDYLQDTYFAIAFTLVLVLIFLGISGAAAAKLANGIGKPMRACAERMELLAQGDLQAPVPVVNSTDETGVLARATGDLVNSLCLIIQDIDHMLTEISQQNLNVQSKYEDAYVGDFSNINQCMNRLRVNLSGTLHDIDRAAEQVSAASDQVANGAQALGQGSVEQASSVEELAATINDLTGQVRDTAVLAEEAQAQTNHASEEADKCNRQMHELIQAMEDIQKRSDEIGKIIKTIEDIAFQTNILALNAAVEAARAGTAGKGFAVVADEVRNLAGKSAEASQSTADLIAGSTQAVQRGAAISGSTAETLEEMVSSMQSVTHSIGQIAEAFNEESGRITQVSIGIEQISSVVQTNSATAEQSAAASEELSAEAQSLKQMVKQFTLAQ